MNVRGVLRHNVPNKGLLAPQKRLSSYGKRRDHFRHAFCLFYCLTNTARSRGSFILFSPMQDGGELFVDEEGDQAHHRLFPKGKGYIEPQQRAAQPGAGGVQLLVEGDDHIHGHELAIEGVNDEIVQRPGQHRRHGAPAQGAQQRPLAALDLFIDQPRGDHIQAPQDEIGQLAHPAGGAADEDMEHVFDQTNRRPGQGPIGKGGQKRGELGKIQLDESWHKGDAELQEHEDEADGAKHGGGGQCAGLFAALVGHNDVLSGIWRGFLPRKNALLDPKWA